MQFTFFQQLMLPQYLCAGVETLLNKLIQQTAYCAPYLRKLNNKVLAVKLQKIDLPIYFSFLHNGLSYSADMKVKLTVLWILRRAYCFICPRNRS